MRMNFLTLFFMCLSICWWRLLRSASMLSDHLQLHYIWVIYISTIQVIGLNPFDCLAWSIFWLVWVLICCGYLNRYVAWSLRLMLRLTLRVRGKFRWATPSCWGNCLLTGGLLMLQVRMLPWCSWILGGAKLGMTCLELRKLGQLLFELYTAIIITQSWWVVQLVVSMKDVSILPLSGTSEGTLNGLQMLVHIILRFWWSIVKLGFVT